MFHNMLVNGRAHSAYYTSVSLRIDHSVLLETMRFFQEAVRKKLAYYTPFLLSTGPLDNKNARSHRVRDSSKN